MNQRNTMNQLKLRKKSRLMSHVLGALSLIFLLGFMWVVNGYLTAHQQYQKIEQTVDEQTSALNAVIINYLQAAQGHTHRLAAIEPEKSQFSQLLNQQQSFIEETQINNAIKDIKNLQSDWQNFTKLLSPALDNQSNIDEFKRSLATVSTTAERMDTTINELKSSTASLSEGKALTSQLNGLPTYINQLVSLSKQLVLNTDNQIVVQEQLKQALSQFSQQGTELLDELDFQGEQIDSALKSTAIATLNQQIKMMQENVFVVQTLSPAYQQVAANLPEILQKNQLLKTDLVQLKHHAINYNHYPIDSTPLNALQLAMTLFILVLICFALWVWSLVKYHQKQLNEATALQLAAQQLQQQDKAAIARLYDELQVLTEGDLSLQLSDLDNLTAPIAGEINKHIGHLREAVELMTQVHDEVNTNMQQSLQQSKQMLSTNLQQMDTIKDSTMAATRIEASLQSVGQHSSDSADIASAAANLAYDSYEHSRRATKQLAIITDDIQSVSQHQQQSKDNVIHLNDSLQSTQNQIAELSQLVMQTDAIEAGELKPLVQQLSAGTEQLMPLGNQIQTQHMQSLAALDNTQLQIKKTTKVINQSEQSAVKAGRVSQQLSMLIRDTAELSAQLTDISKEVTNNIGKAAEINQQSHADVLGLKHSAQRLNKLATNIQLLAANYQLPSKHE